MAMCLLDGVISMTNNEVSRLHKRIIHLNAEIKWLNEQLSECHKLILNAHIAHDRLEKFSKDQVLDLNNEITRGVYFYPILIQCGITDADMKNMISKMWHRKHKEGKENGNMGTD